ncbi:PREDICTED: ejaculatory bulb-specific protein 3 [Vollenhovia emeryi]|uniref:ejaculatory bulb-specific protein 3 n=1 Tax=Vollenhovia emeryi TaxID=411798 RepID=UPI0005F4441A|nr:PREDICTED: ejaculatory bulb-specific protein 3 [Vollenhovia emeryi]XP_011866528.1 PREDICTED: ejaculatory bulb-specific protein 3 [Vollenhovia emeryi]
MTKGYLLVLLISLVALVVADEKYTRKYDDVNVDKILQNNRVLTSYIRCLMDEGPCTAEGRELKKTLPDALLSGCDKCSDKQKDMAEKVINHLKTKRSRDWDRLVAKYDPQSEYKKRYEKS